MTKKQFVALVTPFLETGGVDYKSLEGLVGRQVSDGVDGLVLCGTTGEGWALSDDEKFEMLKFVVGLVKGQVQIVFNSGSCSTEESAGFTERAATMGADSCMAIVPYYNLPSKEGVYRHFEKICSVGIPIILYHHPGRTGVKLSLEELKVLAEMDGIVAIKESSGDLSLVRELVQSVPVYSGIDTLTREMVELGAQGTISVIGNAFPKEWSEFVKGQRENCFIDWLEALEIEVNPQCIKYVMSLMGYCKPVYRLPLIPPKEKTQRVLSSLVDQLEKAPHLSLS